MDTRKSKRPFIISKFDAGTLEKNMDNLLFPVGQTEIISDLVVCCLATSVQISPNTLKRIFGKLKTHERYYPQKATRDALVQ